MGCGAFIEEGGKPLDQLQTDTGGAAQQGVDAQQHGGAHIGYGQAVAAAHLMEPGDIVLQGRRLFLGDGDIRARAETAGDPIDRFIRLDGVHNKLMGCPDPFPDALIIRDPDPGPVSGHFHNLCQA